MYSSLGAFFSSLIVRGFPIPSVLGRFRYRARRSAVGPASTDMAEEAEKARVTELLVRMDCNGCVQRIKKSLNNIEGVYEVYTDMAQQKLVVVGRADPERILKAIRRTKKVATICSHTDPTAEQAPPVPPTEEPPSTEAPPPPDEQPSPPPTELLPPAIEPPMIMNTPIEQMAKLEMNNPPTEVQVRMVHEYPHIREYPSNDNDEYYHHYGVNGNGMRQYENYSYLTHSYNSYRPSAYVSEYAVPGYGNNDYYRRERTDGHITSAFSDENPNACTIV